MHGHCKADLVVRGEALLRLPEIHPPRLVDVDEDRDAAGPNDGEGGCKSAERRCQNRVAGSQAQGAQADLDGVEAARAADGVRDAAVRCEVALEGVDLLPEYVPTAGADPLDGLQHVGSDDRPQSIEGIGGNRLRAARHTASLALLATARRGRALARRRSPVQLPARGHAARRVRRALWPGDPDSHPELFFPNHTGIGTSRSWAASTALASSTAVAP